MGRRLPIKRFVVLNFADIHGVPAKMPIKDAIIHLSRTTITQG